MFGSEQDALIKQITIEEKIMRLKKILFPVFMGVAILTASVITLVSGIGVSTNSKNYLSFPSTKMPRYCREE